MQEITDSLKVIENAKVSISHYQDNLFLIFICYVLGVLLDIIFKVKVLSKDPNFKLKEFCNNIGEQTNVLMSIIIMIILIICRENIAGLKYKTILLGDWMYLAYAITGLTVNAVGDKFISGYQQYLMKLVDKKTE